MSDRWNIGSLVVPRKEKVQPSALPTLPYVGLEHVESNTGRLLGYVPAETMRSQANRFYKGDVLYSRLRPYLNKVWLADRDGLCSSEFIVMPGNESVDAAFLRLRLSARDFVQFANSLNAGDRPRVDFGQISPFKLPSFGVKVQRRIVAKVEALFSELEAGVAALKQARAQLAVYRQALLRDAFEGRLTADWRSKHAPSLETGEQLLERIRAEMPEAGMTTASAISSSCADWLELSLAEITKESLIGLVRASDLQNQEGRGVRYIKMDRVDMSGHVDMETNVYVDCSDDEIKRFALKLGDILFNTRNSVELVGKTGLVRKAPSAPTVFNNNLMRIRVVKPVLPSFLNYQMCAPNFRNAMEQVKKATTSVAAVYGKDLWPLRVVVPSTSEQQQIVDALDDQLDAVESMETDIDVNLGKAEALRQAILKKAFAGELVPQDPADEPAAALLARIAAEREAVTAPGAKKRAARSRGAV